MPVFQLDESPTLPRPDLAEEDGLLAVGGDLSCERLLVAYANGIFPWPHEGYPLLWFSPPRRMVLPVAELHVPRRLARLLRQERYEVRLDTAFGGVVDACATVPRRDESGTWITPGMAEAYTALHALGVAHSAEAWREGRLVGGLYGVCLGGVFVGESMFARETNASKVALVTLVRQLRAWDIPLFDAQIHTAHMETFGAREWPRRRYLRVLSDLVSRPTRLGPWRIETNGVQDADDPPSR